ncbi:hypothetical protein H4219_000056 [Mycoemilia scoparia]|uniref:Uncharacterized protein n=1 Tax=Mycoemilia scoparia TaxID=417184 RepID=A0A9W8DRW7_9FUNG|nr:hypothetical protein H4219_000056 [Mycoemilia scoparia]
MQAETFLELDPNAYDFATKTLFAINLVSAAAGGMIIVIVMFLRRLHPPVAYTAAFRLSFWLGVVCMISHTASTIASRLPTYSHKIQHSQSLGRFLVWAQFAMPLWFILLNCAIATDLLLSQLVRIKPSRLARIHRWYVPTSSGVAFILALPLLIYRNEYYEAHNVFSVQFPNALSVTLYYVLAFDIWIAIGIVYCAIVIGIVVTHLIRQIRRKSRALREQLVIPGDIMATSLKNSPNEWPHLTISQDLEDNANNIASHINQLEPIRKSSHRNSATENSSIEDSLESQRRDRIDKRNTIASDTDVQTVKPTHRPSLYTLELMAPYESVSYSKGPSTGATLNSDTERLGGIPTGHSRERSYSEDTEMLEEAYQEQHPGSQQEHQQICRSYKSKDNSYRDGEHSETPQEKQDSPNIQMLDSIIKNNSLEYRFSLTREQRIEIPIQGLGVSDGHQQGHQWEKSHSRSTTKAKATSCSYDPNAGSTTQSPSTPKRMFWKTPPLFLLQNSNNNDYKTQSWSRNSRPPTFAIFRLLLYPLVPIITLTLMAVVRWVWFRSTMPPKYIILNHSSGVLRSSQGILCLVVFLLNPALNRIFKELRKKAGIQKG